MAGAKKAAIKTRDVIPAPEFTRDDIERALSGEQQLRNSYYSLSDYLKKFQPCTIEQLEPQGGTIIHNYWQRGRLTTRQTVAWLTFWGISRSQTDHLATSS